VISDALFCALDRESGGSVQCDEAGVNRGSGGSVVCANRAAAAEGAFRHEEAKSELSLLGVHLKGNLMYLNAYTYFLAYGSIDSSLTK
jgi:hypothetical protein